MAEDDVKDANLTDPTQALIDVSGATVMVGGAEAPTVALSDEAPEVGGDLKAKILAKLAASNAAEPTEDPLIGAEIADRFHVLSRIGEGGMGVVYKARQKNMDRDVAIKVLLAEMAANKTVEKRFFLEALAVSKLRHPNTIQIFDFGETTEGQLYIAMEFLDGKSLKEVLRDDTQFSAKRAAKVVIQMLRSLREAHAKGIVHRDLKPDNIFLCAVGDDPDFVKVLDFGVAKLMESDTDEPSLTKTGAIFGTPRYMSPEQSVSSNVDHRSDLYAIGVMLFEMLMGRPPFVAEMPLSLLIMHVQDPVPSFHALRPDLVVPPELEALTRKLLEKKVADRFQDADEVLRDLEALEESLDAVFCDVVTVVHAERVGLTVRSQPDTSSQTELLSRNLQTDVTLATRGAAPSRRRGSPLRWLLAGLLVLALVGGTGFASLTPLPADVSRGGTLSPLDTGALTTLSKKSTASLVVPPADLVQLSIKSTPSGADVFDGDTRIGKTPLVLSKLRDPTAQAVWRVSLAGFEPTDLRFSGGADLVKTVALTPVPVAVEPPKRKPRKNKRPEKVVPAVVEKVITPLVIEKVKVVVPKKKPKKVDPFQFNKAMDTKATFGK